MSRDLAHATVAELGSHVRAHHLSAREMLEAMIERVERGNPPLGAVVTMDVDAARQAATRADQAAARGEWMGPLHGIPITIKDVWETAGMRTTSGAPELADHVPTADAVAVRRLRRAGAVIVGKTNTPVYAADIQTDNELFGRTSNPWDLSRTAGGSSGGAAAAVAAGFTPLELGSDIGGSIRNPAHCCGVYGLKPTWGLIPLRGHIPGPPGSRTETDVNCGGPLARSVADLATALEVLAGPLPELAGAWRLDLPEPRRRSALADLRLAVVVDDEDFGVAAPIRDALRAAADRLADAGVAVTDVALPVPLRDLYRSWQDLVLPVIGADLPDAVYGAFAPAADEPEATDVMGRFARRLAARHRDVLRADARRRIQMQAWATHFESYDATMMPTLAVPAFPHDTDRSFPERTVDVDGRSVAHVELMAWCGAVGAVLLPVVDLPVGTSADGLPIGAQLIGPAHADRDLLAVAASVDGILGGVGHPPGY